MKKIRIGIICPSEIAFRRFMPAIKKHECFEYVGVAYPSQKDWNTSSKLNIDVEREKAKKFKEVYGGKIYEGYSSLIQSNEVDAIYLPLPPALHFQWGKLVLENSKHLFLEKPSTTCYSDTVKLIELATEKKLALHENYMFQYHNQIKKIEDLINQNIVGETRLIRTNFGFPKRDSSDFRYNKKLGGGALLDCGGYPLRLVSKLLGENVKVDASKLVYNSQEIDLYGAVQLSNDRTVAQISFGMDNAYKCDIEVWGSCGTLYSGRIFTAPNGLETKIIIHKNNEEEVFVVESDDTFYKSIDKFYECINGQKIRENEYKELLLQSKLVEDVIRMSE